MDAFTQLSLMAKARRVFESEDTFLSFPALSPISWRPEELAFAAPVAMTPQILASMSEFARLTNAIPRGPIAPQEEGEYLWDVYRDVLETAQVAEGQLSPAEAARYAQATSLLYSRSADGLQSDSAALRAYKQHRDAHIAALEQFRNEQVTAETSEDPAAHAQWREQDEPRLRQAIKTIEEQWLTDGLKLQVEEALQVEQACAARAPRLIWEAWRTSFMADLDMQTDTNLIDYAITSFSPYDFFDDGAWPQFTLTRAEMSRLVDLAPRELADVLGSSADEGIERVSFEYRSVAVTRPWFRPALFKSRIWRLPGGGALLSEGSAALRGRCPAYITAIVFARNVSIEHVPQAVPPPAAPRPPVLPRRPTPPVVRDRHRPVVVRNHRDGRRDHRDGGREPRVVVVRNRRPDDRHVRVRPSEPRRHLAAARAGRIGFSTLAPGAAERTAAATAASAAAATPGAELSIIAYVCKRVARCPDPDLDLSWG